MQGISTEKSTKVLNFSTLMLNIIKCNREEEIEREVCLQLLVLNSYCFMRFLLMLFTSNVIVISCDITRREKAYLLLILLFCKVFTFVFLHLMCINSHLM